MNAATVPPVLNCAGRPLDLSVPRVMGVLNVTPDSFSDGGDCFRDGAVNLDAALRRAEQMIAEGAAIIDIGGESTRPGAAEVSPQQEVDRVLPVVEAIAARLDTIISIDTSNPELMAAGERAGAGLINDVRALRRAGALKAAAATGLPVCLMHMQGEPGVMQQAPHYTDVVAEVSQFLDERAQACLAAGIARERIVVDPGFGFGKTPEHNLILLHRLGELRKLGYPVLAGLSRKSLIGVITGRDVNGRLAGSIALATLAVVGGASVIRAHDVAQTLDAVRLCAAVARESIHV